MSLGYSICVYDWYVETAHGNTLDKDQQQLHYYRSLKLVYHALSLIIDRYRTALYSSALWLSGIASATCKRQIAGAIAGWAELC